MNQTQLEYDCRNKLVEAFHQIDGYLVIIAEHQEFLAYSLEKRTDLSVKGSLFGDFVGMLRSQEKHDEAKAFGELVNEVRLGHHSVLEALDGMPSILEKKLSSLAGKPWRAMVLADAIYRIAIWGECDPHEDWSAIRRNLYLYQRDLDAVLADPLADGPLDIGQWVLNGELLEAEMANACWKMTKFLWDQPNKRSSFDDLKRPVYDDPDHVADESAYGSLRRKANRYFSVNGVPWRVSLKQNFVLLKPLDS
ncbi:hypothetical protein [Adhaeretor mobilis]|uniref:hypothetical protein n=1 Tax=Adhaeretor mobilis TaxID=1930276 RepID=UPI0011A5CC9B|nr:hypothetical protein [Adhaeretor mobilis]